MSKLARAALPAEVSREGHLDSMAVNVEIKPEHATAAATAEEEYVSHDLQYHIKSYVGISIRVEIKAAGAIERSVGKAKRVIDTRPK